MQGFMRFGVPLCFLSHLLLPEGVWVQQCCQMGCAQNRLWTVWALGSLSPLWGTLWPFTQFVELTRFTPIGLFQGPMTGPQFQEGGWHGFSSTTSHETGPSEWWSQWFWVLTATHVPHRLNSGLWDTMGLLLILGYGLCVGLVHLCSYCNPAHDYNTQRQWR